MRGLIQRVSEASVCVANKVIGRVGFGLLLFVAFEKGDSPSKLLPFLEKVARYRIFSDEKGLMNKSLLDVSGDLLIVSQFTLAANTKKGLRPSFSSGLPIEEAKKLYDELVRQAKKKYDFKIEEGRFGSEMDVSLINAGPATFILDL
tara:strand:- start:1138 stop:1578 length:441 start_codon:yes stop_codon:yes gene_type:complete